MKRSSAAQKLFLLATVLLCTFPSSQSAGDCLHFQESGGQLTPEELGACLLKEENLERDSRAEPTGGKAEFHLASIDLHSFAEVLDFGIPFYLIGIEKIDYGRSTICGESPSTSCFDTEKFIGAYPERKLRAGKVLKRHLNGHLRGAEIRRLLVTHVAYFASNPHDSCFLFSFYPPRDRSPVCAGSTGNSEAPSSMQQIWDTAYQAIEEESKFGTHIKGLWNRYKPTHVFVFATGWETPESKSLARYQEWLRAIEHAKPPSLADWRPLAIGFAWESKWDKPVISQPVKGNDADEVGVQWGNMLMSKHVRPLAEESGAKVVLIGHSFGARVVTESVLRRALVDSHPRGPVDLVVGLQPAFSINRFDRDRSCWFPLFDCAPFFNWEDEWGVGLFTCSRADRTIALAPKYAGNCATFNKLRGFHGKYEQTSSSDGSLQRQVYPGSTYFIEAAFIRSHGDVYDSEVGRLIWAGLGYD